MRLVLVADHIGIWVSGLFSKFFMLFLSSICGGFWEETLGSEGGVLGWLVCVKKKQTNKNPEVSRQNMDDEYYSLHVKVV